MAKNNTYDSATNTSDLAGTSTRTGSRFSELGSSASGQIDNSPLIALGAGLAIGAVLGAVLPTSSRERELLEPYGRKLSDAGTGALDRGRGLAKQKFDEMAGDKVREFLGSSSTSSNA